jgi:zinc-ribbon domain
LTDREASAPTEKPRKRLPLWILALGGAVAAGGYALLVEKMRFGPPLVMFALGGMTLALCGAALVRMIDPLTSSTGGGGPATARGGRRARELEREKQLVLKAIKEVELDYQMRKIAERDYRDMVERYRTRAMRLMSELEAGDDFRALIEKELAMRLKLEGVKPVSQADVARSLAAETRQALKNLTPDEEKALRKRYGTGEQQPSCASCGTLNDDDAQFCKKCGAKLTSA